MDAIPTLVHKVSPDEISGEPSSRGTKSLPKSPLKSPGSGGRREKHASKSSNGHSTSICGSTVAAQSPGSPTRTVHIAPSGRLIVAVQIFHTGDLPLSGTLAMHDGAINVGTAATASGAADASSSLEMSPEKVVLNTGDDISTGAFPSATPMTKAVDEFQLRRALIGQIAPNLPFPQALPSVHLASGSEGPADGAAGGVERQRLSALLLALEKRPMVPLQELFVGLPVLTDHLAPGKSLSV